ncbi:cardiolipin synthase [Crateriforma spongiae]|uniref:cardiolipin synthase n=1 Tax=Crateriforma spongiae TaxID=2724528 RepID=UPI001446E865|nr:cardiolipin synthase [Crateriforma spongiae]
MSDFLLHASTWAVVTHVTVVAALSVRVIMNRPATGVALSWILLILATPVFGSALYLMVGERRIGRRRRAGFQGLRENYRRVAETAAVEGLTNIRWDDHTPGLRGMDQIGRRLVGFPTVRGSRHRLFSKTDEILLAIARDVDQAEFSVLMEFYIWHPGGLADEVLEALIRAAGRGVHCCVLIDALGARPWWKTDQPQRLRDAGVQLHAALPVGLFRTFVGRTDLRLHRKIVVVDGHIAWTGSMNLVDPRFFKQDAGVGQWVDSMARLEGSAVALLAAVFIGDWNLESGTPLAELVERAKLRLIEPDGPSDLQVIPSGPGQSGDAQLQMILTLLNTAREEIVLTTPYLVPDESLLRAMNGASARGVTVRLIVPEKVDSFLTRYASRSYFQDLLDHDIEVYLYRDGLLHTKAITVDGQHAMFGTVNLDMRSFWLNYEVALYIYDSNFAAEIRQLQQTYLDDSDRLDPEQFAQRSFKERFLENSLRLASPLL